MFNLQFKLSAHIGCEFIPEEFLYYEVIFQIIYLKCNILVISLVFYIYNVLRSSHGMKGLDPSYNFSTIGVDGSGTNQATLTGLSPYTRYAIVLQVFNSCGAGPSSSVTYGTTLEDSMFYVY